MNFLALEMKDNKMTRIGFEVQGRCKQKNLNYDSVSFFFFFSTKQ